MRYSSLISGTGALLLTVFLSSCGTNDVSQTGTDSATETVLGDASDIYAAKRCSGATLAVSPNPVPYDSTYAITATGFTSGGSVVATLERQCDFGIIFKETIWSGSADASGSISFSRMTGNCKGTYIVSAYEGRRGRCGTVSFAVY